MHGGARGSGAPVGKANGRYRHGGATKEALAATRELRAWVKVMEATQAEVEG